jgi:DNA topoisomerase I
MRCYHCPNRSSLSNHRQKRKLLRNFLAANTSSRHLSGISSTCLKSKIGIDVKNDLKPQYITIRGKGPILNDIKKEARKAKKILLATDLDREGEAISWHLAKALNIDQEEPCRIVFNEITKAAIKTAIKTRERSTSPWLMPNRPEECWIALLAIT